MQIVILCLLALGLCASEAALPAEIQKTIDAREAAAAKAKAAYDAAMTKVNAEAVKAMEKAVAARTKAGDLEGAMAGKKLMDGWKSTATPDGDDHNGTADITVNRKRLDPRLRFIGSKSENANWLADDKVLAANNGQAPNPVTHGDIILADKLFGEQLVTFIHPINDKTPGFVDFSTILNGTRGTLVLKLRNFPTGDCKATILVDGKDTESMALSGNTWKTVKVPYTATNKVQLRVDSAGGWWCEHCLFTYDVLP